MVSEKQKETLLLKWFREFWAQPAVDVAILVKHRGNEFCIIIFFKEPPGSQTQMLAAVLKPFTPKYTVSKTNGST